MNKHSIRYAAIVVALFAALFASAAPKVDVQPGTAMYLVVLRDSAKAPDLTALGGRVLESSMNRRVVLLPESRAEELRSHAAVAYMQRIWGGEPLSDSPRPAPRSASSVVSNATLYEDWASGAYAYDPSGNIKKIGNDAYGYDRVSRITGASIPNRNVSETYAYDPFGNLERLGAKTFAVQHGTNRLEPPLMTYDDSGFVTGDTTAPNHPRNYHYDALGMMTAIDDVSEDRRMIYTADDERIVLSVGENTSYRIRDFGGKVLREWKSVAGVLAWDRNWIYGDGQLLAGAVQVDTRLDPARHYHADHLGSIRMVTDGAGTTITRNDFAPFGRELTETSQEYDNTAHVRDPLKFTAHERDYFSPANVNDDDYIDDMHARYYGPGVGRFLAVDPVLNVKRALREPQNWNRYSYVTNNPLRYTDPDGRDHYQEPGFTKPMTAENLAMDENTPAVVRYSVYATGGLTALGAAGFLGAGGLVASAEEGLSAAGTWALANWDKIQRFAEGVVDFFSPGPSSGRLTSFERASNQLANQLQFTEKTAGHMKEAGRMVPRSILAQAILKGARSADPQGAPGAVQITQNIVKNGKDYVLRIVYREKDHMILHFHYAAAK